MLTRLSEFLRRHEPITRLLMRAALLLIFASVAWDFHYLSMGVGDIADRVDEMQQDFSRLSDSIEEGGGAPDVPAKLDSSQI